MSTVKDFSCIGGLEKHIRIVKEMVLFPLMYGDVYAKFNLTPPRGLLFYGPPGTGKTLVASALAQECSNSERKVSFISRKGSDCLSKWVGESERKLQKIFTMAQQTKPCIIFFDEVDGLAPVRSSKQDFVHASIVSTLLALMDGLENNSEIIVIGATNRIDAIDPALRRPGRFDRELFFPLPCYTARKDIISVHIKSWKQKPSPKFLAYLASRTVGYCGSDLQALCAEAVMCCVRRNYPQIYTSKSRHYINERHLKVEKQDFLKAQQNIVPASHRISIIPVKCLPVRVQPLLQNNLSAIMAQLQSICPAEMLPSDSTTCKCITRSTSCPRILLCGDDDSHTRYLGPALLHTLEHLPCHTLDVTTLFEETGRAAEESIIQKVKGARRTLPSLLYVPDILAWWNLVDEAARVVFTSLVKDLDHSIHILILATANCQQLDLPPEIANLYDEMHGEIYEVKPPGVQERQSFFKQLFTGANSDTVSSKSSQADFVPISQKKSNYNKKRYKGPLRNMESSEFSEPQETSETHPTKRCRSEYKTRNKFGTVRANSPLATKSRMNVKRERCASGEGPAAKRQRLSCTNNTTFGNEKLSDPQIQELLQKIVELTEGWPTCQLESLYASIEVTLEGNDSNMVGAVEDCLSRYDDMRSTRIYTSNEEIYEK